MNRTTSIALAAFLVVAAIGIPLAAASVASSGAQPEPEPDDGNDSIEPGERFAAAVGVQNAEIEGDVAERAFGVRIANAETNETKAAVVAEQVSETERRLTELEDRLAALNESREAGELGEGRYRAEVATTVAELRSLERRTAAAETAAAELPERALAEHDVDVESIRTLRDRAGELGGPETAAIAREIAGEDGRSIGGGPDPNAPIGGGDGEHDGDGNDERDGDGDDDGGDP